VFVRWSDRAAAKKIGIKLHNTYTDQLYRKAEEEVHRILLESTPDPWPLMLGSIPHKQSAAQN